MIQAKMALNVSSIADVCRSAAEANVPKAEERSDEAAMLCCAMGRAPLPATSYFLTPPLLSAEAQDVRRRIFILQ